MAFKSSETIKNNFINVIKPFNDKRVQNGAYELSLGAQAYTTQTTFIQPLEIELKEYGCITIPPGQFALLICEEEICMPNSILGFLSVKSSIKLEGLINVSGFHVDPGFKGKLKFAVYNAGSREIVLQRGQAIFIIWFADFDGNCEPYNSKGKDFSRLTADDIMNIHGEIPSPNVLKERIDSLSNIVKIWGMATLAVLSFFIKDLVTDKPYQTIEKSPTPKINIIDDSLVRKIDSLEKLTKDTNDIK